MNRPKILEPAVCVQVGSGPNFFLKIEDLKISKSFRSSVKEGYYSEYFHSLSGIFIVCRVLCRIFSQFDRLNHYLGGFVSIC